MPRDLAPENPTIAALLKPLHSFLSAESAGGIVLLASTVVALVWANSPLHESYHTLWHTPLVIAIGSWSLSMSLEMFVNDFLMAIFFLLVGLEIKREIRMGELASPQRAALPVAAALGGMIVPALIFTLFNAGTDASHGWGIPMATDIAFAVGVLALVGRGVPTSLKVFLLAIAIVDDLGAVLVIALFYAGHISWIALGVAGGFCLALMLLNVLRIYSPLPYMIVGAGLWLAMYYSGAHATIAGVLLAFAIPARRRIEEQPFIKLAQSSLDLFAQGTTIEPDRITPRQSEALQTLEQAAQAVQTPLARVEHALLGTVNFGIVPIFALANAGVNLTGGLGSVIDAHIVPGVMLGLLIGKPVGVLLFSWLACRARIAKLPHDASWRQLLGIAVLCGVGFTMSLFIAHLAFAGNASHLSATKVAVLGASLLAGIIGALLLRWAPPAGSLNAPIP